MLEPDARFRSLVNLATAGEKQIGQQQSASPVKNASPICAEGHKAKTRMLQINGALKNENSSGLRNPHRRTRTIYGMVPTKFPSVSDAMIWPMIRSLKWRSVR